MLPTGSVTWICSSIRILAPVSKASLSSKWRQAEQTSSLTWLTKTNREDEGISAERRLTFVFTDMSNAPTIGRDHKNPTVRHCTRRRLIVRRDAANERRDMVERREPVKSRRTAYSKDWSYPHTLGQAFICSGKVHRARFNSRIRLDHEVRVSSCPPVAPESRRAEISSCVNTLLPLYVLCDSTHNVSKRLDFSRAGDGA